MISLLAAGLIEAVAQIGWCPALASTKPPLGQAPGTGQAGQHVADRGQAQAAVGLAPRDHAGRVGGDLAASPVPNCVSEVGGLPPSGRRICQVPVAVVTISLCQAIAAVMQLG